MLLAYALALVVGASETVAPASVIGKVQVLGPAQTRGVQVVDDQGHATVVSGDLTDEVAQLQSLQIEIVGVAKADNTMDVREYRIIDVGGGVKPMVGMLEKANERLQLRDGEGNAIPLSMGSKTLQKLIPMAGAKVWVAGAKLISGELRVSKYGILRKPKMDAKTESKQ